MKTIEEKAKAYDEALAIAKDIHDGNPSSCTAITVCEQIFPELKEPEGERVRKWCISHFKACINVIKDNDEYKEYLSNKVIAWLEKQGDYNRLVEEIKERKELLSKEKEKATSTNDKLSLGGRIAILEELLAFTKEKQDKQKPIDKVEPKFKKIITKNTTP